jgi:hypothetical protein
MIAYNYGWLNEILPVIVYDPGLHIRQTYYDKSSSECETLVKE